MPPSQLDSLEEDECLDTVDVVTYREKRWVVSTRNDREMGFVQHRETTFNKYAFWE